MNSTPHNPVNSASHRKFPWMNLLKYVIPPFITFALCWILFTGININEMWMIIRTQCNFWWISLGLIISIASHIFRAMRWQIQLKALDIHPPLFITILSIFGTYAVNLILPRLGELWRTGYIAERQKASFTEVFGSMVCDRLADTITVLILTIVTLIIAHTQVMGYLNQDPAMYEKILAFITSPWLWISLFIILALIWFLFHKYPSLRPVLFIKKLLRGVWNGFIVILKMKGKGKWLFFTALIWLAYFFELFVAFLAFPVTTQVLGKYGITAALVCFIFSTIAMAVPSNGGIGPYQWALIFGLSMYSAGIPGLTLEYSTSFANLVLGANTILLILLGIFTFIYIAFDKRKKHSIK